MKQTLFHKVYGSVKKFVPGFLARSLRSWVTAVATPVRFSIAKGHFRSSVSTKAVDRKGNPLPWYTYPCIDFLKFRDFRDMNILEFGGGQSTLWWASRSSRVVSFEGDLQWYHYLKKQIPSNVELYHVRDENAEDCLSDVNRLLSGNRIQKFDVVVIDGLWRFELIEVAKKHLSPDGAIICDNSDGYGFFEGFRHDADFGKVDFYGFAPGVILQSCTTIYFKANCRLFNPGIETYIIENS